MVGPQGVDKESQRGLSVIMETRVRDRAGRNYQVWPHLRDL